MPHRVVIRADGAARGNPGPASAGAIVVDADRDLDAARRPDAHPIATVSEYLGHRTNNVAEYTAVVRALAIAADLGVREVDLILDSNLVVEQLLGRWKVKDAKLAPLHAEARRLLAGFDRWSATHEPRARNHAADALANEAIDRALGGGPAVVVRLPDDMARRLGLDLADRPEPQLEPGFDPGDPGPKPEVLVVTILGSGTSGGVPRIACECRTCTSTDPRDRRMRSSALLSFGDHRVLIDAGPDLRAQALGARLDRVDAVLLTHEHADAVGGLDDLRRFNEIHGGYLDVHAYPETLEVIVRRWGYAFVPGQRRFVGLPQLRPVELGGPFFLGGRRFIPVPVLHGEMRIAGYRTGAFAYLSDVKRVESEAKALLHGLDVLVVSALRNIPHPTHQTVAEALELIAELRPRRAFLTHLDHDLLHAEVAARVPDGVEVAWDGLAIDVRD